jgi:hypothetical protein
LIFPTLQTHPSTKLLLLRLIQNLLNHIHSFLSGKQCHVRFEAGQARFTAAFVLHLAGWAAGGVEMFFIFRILGCPITFFQAIILESLLQLVRLTSF